MNQTTTYKIARLLLQIIQGLLGALALFTGARLIYGGAGLAAEQTYLPQNLGFDSMLRFVGGIWTGVGLLLLWGIPRIEAKGPHLRAAWTIIFLGGLGRLVSLVHFGLADPEATTTSAIEVLVPPALLTWQYLLSLAAQKQVPLSPSAPSAPAAAIAAVPRRT